MLHCALHTTPAKTCQIITLKMHIKWLLAGTLWLEPNRPQRVAIRWHAESIKMCCIPPMVMTPHPQEGVYVWKLLSEGIAFLTLRGNRIAEVENWTKIFRAPVFITRSCWSTWCNSHKCDWHNYGELFIRKEYKMASKTNTSCLSHLFKANWCK